MVKDNEHWPRPEQSAWQQVNKSFTSSLLRPVPAWTNSAHMAFPFPLPNLGTEQTAPSKKFVYPSGFPATALLNGIPSPCPQKKLLVFDRCGTHTRLIYSSATPATDTTKVTCHHSLLEDAKVDRIGLTKPVEDYCGDGDESELHEDTEELNALLYSDDEDESSDEERSTGHSPVPNAEELAEVSSFCLSKKRPKPDVSDSSGPSPNKRQKFIGVGLGPNRSDSDIRDTLRVLESIVPGVKGKEPLLVLDKAIEYLKCMKLRAVSLGVDSLLT